MNFDAKLRRQSIDPADLIHAHVGGIDLSARAFLAAARIFEECRLANEVVARYSGWEAPQARAMLDGEFTLDAIAARVEAEELKVVPRSGRQERLENLIGRYL
jgi:xylose isomerase